MRLPAPILPLAAAALLAAAVLAAPPRPAEAAVDRGAPGEVQRLRTHFAQVERELLARDVSALTASQRAARSRHVTVLREYAAAGVFPHNHHHRQAIPYFVDDHGTHCAMAYLIARSGRGDLVRRVASTRNNAYVRELADDPELVAWLDANGLTAGEAARIQPFYGEEPQEDTDRQEMAYLIPTVAVGVANVAVIALTASDAPGSGRQRSRLGVVAGSMGIALGIAGVRGDEHREIGVASLALGTISAFIGVRTLLGRVEEPTPPDGQVTLTAAPVLSPQGVGLHFNARF
ncbi:MAG TPA: hypothetical protein VEW03_08325 [Longimicrobiaceae bacterium]|nr:hypothetical protein [Longimicrobiaceae bacterium]